MTGGPPTSNGVDSGDTTLAGASISGGTSSSSLAAADGLDAFGGSNSGPGAAGKAIFATGGSTSATSGAIAAGDAIYAVGGDCQSTTGTGGTGVHAVAGNGLNVGPAALFEGTVDFKGDPYSANAALLNLPNGGMMNFNSTGTGAPADTSKGWRIKLWNYQFDYGFGINNSELWYSSGGLHKWYTTNGTPGPSEYTAQMSLDTTGALRTRGAMIANTTPDLAETIPATSDVGVADVVCVDPAHAERVVRCSRSSGAVLGVISDGSSSFLINAHGGGVDAPLTGAPLVLAGRVPVNVSLENGPISPGDYLGPSSLAGVAMRMTDAGRAVGIALDSFDGHGGGGGAGQVLCFVKVGEANVASEVVALRAENGALRTQATELRNEVDGLRARLDRMESLVTELASRR